MPFMTRLPAAASAYRKLRLSRRQWEHNRWNRLPPAGKTDRRDSIRSKVFEEKGWGFGGGEEKLSPESFSSPNLVRYFFRRRNGLQYACSALWPNS